MSRAVDLFYAANDLSVAAELAADDSPNARSLNAAARADDVADCVRSILEVAEASDSAKTHARLLKVSKRLLAVGNFLLTVSKR